MNIKHTLSRLAILTVVLAMPASAFADLIATLQPTTQELTVGESSFFDLLVTGTSVMGDPVSGYSIALEGVSGISFTGVTTATDPPISYIFPDAEGLLVVSTSPDLTYLDNTNPITMAGPTNVTSATTYSAGRIFFDAVAPGFYTINFDPAVGRNAFTDSGGSAIPTTFNGATINVLPAAVPEPTTTLLLILTGVVGLFVTRFRRRRSPEPAAG